MEPADGARREVKGAYAGQSPSTEKPRSSSSDKRALRLESLDIDEGDPYAINQVHFNPDMFIHKMIQEYPLDRLMQTETKLIRQINDLDSDMQTLVYENYNKFILATDTIRKMKTDFREMEDKMALLSSNIAAITQSSTEISASLQEKRDKVSRLSGINDLLKKLKYLFELPNKLKKRLEESNYEEAVQCYLSGLEYVNEFKRFPSLEAIKQDCQHIVGQIRHDLYEDFNDPEKSSQDLTRNVFLLLSLGEVPSNLAEKFLDNALPKLAQNLESLKSASSPNILLDEFMELGCGLFLSNLSLVVASFSQAFIQATELDQDTRVQAQDTLKQFVTALMDEFLELMEARLSVEARDSSQHETEVRENYLKAMDRLYRRLMAMGTLMPNTDFTPAGLELISKVTHIDAEMSLERIKSSYSKAVKESGAELRAHPGASQEVMGSILATFIGQMKTGLNRLQDYCRPEFHFSQNAEFRQRTAAVTVREGLVVDAFKFLIDFGNNLIEDASCDILIWLLIAKLYLDIETGTVEYMVNAVESDFEVRRDRKNPQFKLTSVADLTSGFNTTAKRLASEFVASQGNQLAELMKEAVLDKDLLSMGNDPEEPQPQMKKTVEILTRLEKHVETIFPDTESAYIKSERSSDSSKRSYSTLPTGGVTSNKNAPSRQPTPFNLDPNMSSNIQKLFTERIDIFGQVELNKTAILMSVVKIGLRALLEFARLKTIGKHGLHQIQVDVHYLQLYLWRFVNNETFLHSLLDEVLASSIQRCVGAPTLLDTTLVEIIAEASKKP